MYVRATGSTREGITVLAAHQGSTVPCTWPQDRCTPRAPRQCCRCSRVEARSSEMNARCSMSAASAQQTKKQPTHGGVLAEEVGDGRVQGLSTHQGEGVPACDSHSHFLQSFKCATCDWLCVCWCVRGAGFAGDARAAAALEPSIKRPGPCCHREKRSSSSLYSSSNRQHSTPSASNARDGNPHDSLQGLQHVGCASNCRGGASNEGAQGRRQHRLDEAS